jgi:DnaJ-class molecular chaperone
MLISPELDKAYKLLNATHHTPLETITKTYKKLAIRFHPDKNRNMSNSKMQELNRAFELIKKHNADRNFSIRTSSAMSEGKTLSKKVMTEASMMSIDNTPQYSKTSPMSIDKNIQETNKKNKPPNKDNKLKIKYGRITKPKLKQKPKPKPNLKPNAKL